MAANTSTPTQIGFTPPDFTSSGSSQIIIGRDTTSAWEAIGYGSGARPDVLQTFIVNLSFPQNINAPYDPVNNPLVTTAQISLDVTDIVTAYTSNPTNFPSNLTLYLQEVAVCSGDGNGNTQEARMIIIGSQQYLPAPGS